MSQIPRKPNFPSYMIQKLIQKIRSQVQQNVIPVSTGIYSLQKLQQKLQSIPKPFIQDYQNRIFFEVYQDQKQHSSYFSNNQQCKSCLQQITKKNPQIKCNFCCIQHCESCTMLRKRAHPLILIKDPNGKRYNICRQCDTKYLNLQLSHSFVQNRTLLQQVIFRSTSQLKSISQQIESYTSELKIHQQQKQKNKYKISQLKKQKLQLSKLVNNKIPEDIKIQQNKNLLLKQKFVQIHLKHKEWIIEKNQKQKERLKKISEEQKIKEFLKLKKQQEQRQRLILEQEKRKKWQNQQEQQKRMLIRLYSKKSQQQQQQQEQVLNRQRKKSLKISSNNKKKQQQQQFEWQNTQSQQAQMIDKIDQDINYDTNNNNITQTNGHRRSSQYSKKSNNSKNNNNINKQIYQQKPLQQEQSDQQQRQNVYNFHNNNNNKNSQQPQFLQPYTFQDIQNNDNTNDMVQSFSQDWILRNSTLVVQNNVQDEVNIDNYEQNYHNNNDNNNSNNKYISSPTTTNVQSTLSYSKLNKSSSLTTTTFNLNSTKFQQEQQQAAETTSQLDQNQLQNAKYNLIKAARDKAVKQRQSKKTHKMSIFDNDNEEITGDAKKCQCAIY